jgi:transposase
MEKKFREWPVDQLWLLPPSIKEFVPEGHLAHFVRDTVRDSLNLSAIVMVYQEERGQPPFHPGMMVALLLYAYCQGVYSSRRIARACEERVDFMAVTAMQKPDFRTIALFRKRHLEALSKLFVQVLGLCQKAGLVRLGHVALDGTKVRANASKHKGGNYKRLKQEERRLQAEVKSWFDRAKHSDEAEDRDHGEDRHGDELPQWVKDKKQRLERLQKATKEMEIAAKREAHAKAKTPPKYRGGRKPKQPPGVPRDNIQHNFTDPDSRIMKTSEGFQQCYNGQAAVDSASQIIVAQGITNSASDRRQLKPLLRGIKDNLARQAREISADGDYCSEENLIELNRRHIRGYVSTGRHYQSDGSESRRPPPVGTYARRMWRRLKKAGRRSRYRLRKQVVEPVFGQIKMARGFRQFLLRGSENVAAEWALVCTAHNLLKLAKV